ncbi:MAG: sigma-54-dependent Fis family transcriptional regulator [Bacteroidetes bacterium]|nr:sigma-54-dependent Fis family transcriptional regulator [Bacteroidota bacterium]
MNLPNPNILYLDDEEDNLTVFKSTFRQKFNVLTATTAQAAMSLLQQVPVGVVLSDFRLRETTGIDFLKTVSELYPNTVRILISAYGEKETVIRSINEAKVFSFITKPWDKEDIERVISSAVNLYHLKFKNEELITNLTMTIDELTIANKEIKVLKAKLQKENEYLRREIDNNRGSIEWIGAGEKMQLVKQKVSQVAKLNTVVLIKGETGTGKDLVARSIHAFSNRAAAPFVTLNCSALPGNLIESELFGFEKGSFTGALNNKEGLFELADGGTIFLDEIGEMSIEFQAKLLRVLQNGEFYRIGGLKPINVDVRIIAATNRDLEDSMNTGRFRTDLFYRLNIFPISLPPLRERQEDIPELVKHFLDKFQKKLGIEVTSVSDRVMKMLLNHSWPGNIRELEGLIERSVILSANGELNLHELSAERAEESNNNLLKQRLSFIDMQREYIIQVLNSVNWKISGKGSAAEILQLNHNTLRSTMTRLRINVKVPDSQ